MEKSPSHKKKVAAALRAAPGLRNLLGYRREWLRHDAVFTGILCILASFLRLGLCGGFLAKPILVGFLNGVAIHIFLGQIGKSSAFR